MKFNKTVLKNGLRVVTVPMADNPSVTILVAVETGSKYEDKDTSGISHFLEHMVFKGTPKRPKASLISKELDSIGAHYNAFTSFEFTCYFAKADKKHTDKILDVVADMYQNPLFDQAEIEKEKGVIIEELRMYNDLPQRHVHDILNQLLHGDQPAGRNVIGTEETIKSFDKGAFQAYRKDHYVSSATTVVVAGAFDEKSMIKKIEKAFAGMSDGKKRGKLPVRESQKAPALKIEGRETDQTHLAMAVRTFPIKDKRIPAMAVLSTILGQGMSSRLFTKMRDELGICYYVRASHDALTDHGDLTISAGVDNSRVETAVKELLAECSRLKHERVPKEELQKAKDYIAGSTMLELETSEARAEFAGLEEAMKGKIESPESMIRKIQAVTAAEVKALAKEIFVDGGLNLAMIGRPKEESIRPLLKFS